MQKYKLQICWVTERISVEVPNSVAYRVHSLVVHYKKVPWMRSTIQVKQVEHESWYNAQDKLRWVHVVTQSCQCTTFLLHHPVEHFDRFSPLRTTHTDVNLLQTDLY